MLYDNNDDASEDNSKLPSEIQKAVCTVTAGEVKATAEAVTTKTLKGVCGSAEMNTAFANMELRLQSELLEIKILLQNLIQFHNINIHQKPDLLKNMITESTESSINNNIFQTTTMPKTETLTIKLPVNSLFHEMSSNNSMNFEKRISNRSYSEKKAPQLKSFPDQTIRNKSIIHLREQEVKKFNNTLLTNRNFKVFTYYWRLENFTERIENGLSTMLSSPIFSLKGKSLHIEAHFQHLKRDFLYLQLTYATLESNDRNNIILDMGGIFKQIIPNKINFKHKILILDQNNQRSKDLISQEFNNLDFGFLIPNSALLNTAYIKNDTLLIQIFLYL